MVQFHFTVPDSFLRNRTYLKDFIIRLFKREKKKLRDISYIFCTDEFLLDINKRHLQHDFYTDIISFDLSGNDHTEGEIYISVDRVKENALQFGAPFREELLRVIFHGALHLCGYGDKTGKEQKIMREKEQEYLNLYGK